MTHTQDIIRETIMAPESLMKVRTLTLGQDILITLLDTQGKEIQDQSESIERIDEFFSELYNNQTVPKSYQVSLLLKTKTVNIILTIYTLNEYDYIAQIRGLSP